MPKSKKKSAIVNKDINKKPKVTNKPGKNKQPASAKIVKGDGKAAKSNKPNPDTVKKPNQDSKHSKIIAVMQRKEGATIEELISATGWQQHSIRGHISGKLKKQLGLPVTHYKEARGKIYRITRSR